MRIPIELIDVCMVSKSSPTKDIYKIICRDRNAVLRLKKPASVSSFSLPYVDTSVANQKISINAFVVSGWLCELGWGYFGGRCGACGRFIVVVR